MIARARRLMSRRTLEQWSLPERRRSPMPSRSWATCMSSTGQSSTVCWPTAMRPRRSARHPCRSRRWRARGERSSWPGIGETLQQKILTLLDTGTTPSTERLRAQFPPGLIEITRLPGLGPKRARLLYTELGIDSPEKLREAALAQRLQAVRGFGVKFETSMLAALENASTTQSRRPGACCCRKRSSWARRSPPA